MSDAPESKPAVRARPTRRHSTPELIAACFISIILSYALVLLTKPWFGPAGWLGPPATMTLTDSQGNKATLLVYPDYGSALSLTNPATKGKLEALVTPKGYSIVTLTNPLSGERSIQIDNTTPDGSARIVFYDPATGQPAKVISLDGEEARSTP